MPAGLLAIPTWGLMAIGAGLFLAVAVLVAVALRPKKAAHEADPGIAWGKPHGELPPEEPAPVASAAPPTFEPLPPSSAPLPPLPARQGARAPARQPEFEAAPAVPAGPTHYCRCPACQTQFTVNGPRPIVTNCPGCGRKGFLR